MLWGAPRIQQTTTTLPFIQEAVVAGRVKGTLFSKTQGSGRKPGGARSFVWQEGSVTYAINYYSKNDASKEQRLIRGGILTNEELAKVVQSFVFPEQTRHVRYDGEGNSFPLYDETDWNAAKNILGIPLKFPTDLPDTQFTMSNSILLRTKNHNTGYSFRQSADALWNNTRSLPKLKIGSTQPCQIVSGVDLAAQKQPLPAVQGSKGCFFVHPQTTWVLM